MAAEVSSWSRMLNTRRENTTTDDGGSSDILITRDLLGNLSNGKNREMEFHEFKQLSSPKSPLPTSLTSKAKKEEESSSSSCSSYSDSMLQDLNHLPRNFFLDEKSLDLKLQSAPSNANSTSYYTSVCTLDKVKSALERAERQETSKKRAPWLPISSPTMYAAACPGCLLYVMASSENPRCPRCNSFVPAAGKKPRIDLNESF